MALNEMCIIKFVLNLVVSANGSNKHDIHRMHQPYHLLSSCAMFSLPERFSLTWTCVHRQLKNRTSHVNC